MTYPLDKDTLRLIIAGDGACGKTVLLCAYIGKPVNEGYIPTVLDTYSTIVPIVNQEVKVEIMDTAGQEDLEKIRKLAYSGTHCVILCYNVVSAGTLENVNNFWNPELKQVIPYAPIVLCGNKLDLKEKQPRKYLEPELVEAAVKKIRRIKAQVQCSALDEINNPENYTIETSLVNPVFNFAIKYGLEFKINGPSKHSWFKCNIL